MLLAIRTSWALFLGIALIMSGGGLQGSLVGIRSSTEGFSNDITGFIMAAYFVGFLLGSRVVPFLIGQVGHIRVFAALASVASACALVHALWPDPYVWMAVRLATGFCFSGLYIVAESWLNDQATNENRGQLLSVYVIVQMGFMASGQYLLNLPDPEGFTLFILVSILVSVSLVPMTLATTAAPQFDAPTSISIRKLFQVSPLGTVTAFLIGISQSSFFGLGPVFATEIGLDVNGVANFMAIAIFGSVFAQWPLGRLSDRIDRRLIILVITLIGGVSALGLISLDIESPMFFVYIGLFGAFTFPLYSLALAHINDYLEPDQMLSASATMILTYGLGTIAGPPLVGILMGTFGSVGFVQVLSISHIGLAGYAIYRMTRRTALPVEERGDYVAISPRASVVTAVVAPQTALDEEDQEIDAVFEAVEDMPDDSPEKEEMNG